MQEKQDNFKYGLIGAAGILLVILGIYCLCQSWFWYLLAILGLVFYLIYYFAVSNPLEWRKKNTLIASALLGA